MSFCYIILIDFVPITYVLHDRLNQENNNEELFNLNEGLDGGGGSGIHYSLKFSPLFILLKFWVIH